MSNLVRQKMIVLRKTKYAEADLIVQGLLESGIRVSLIARGALRSKKRFGGGVLEPTHQIEVQYQTPRQGQDLGVLQEAVLLRDFSQIRTNYERIEVALQIVEWLSHVSQESGDDLQDLYHLTGHALSALEDTLNLNAFLAHFMIRFLNQQGVLDHEPWMEPYLKVPMGKSKLVENFDIAQVKIRFLREKVQQYIGLAQG